jgi:hypothetical protein
MLYVSMSTHATVLSGCSCCTGIKYQTGNCIVLGCFEILMNKLQACPSAPTVLTRIGEKAVKYDTLLPETRVLAALWYLGTPDSYRSIAKKWVCKLLRLSLFRDDSTVLFLQ